MEQKTEAQKDLELRPPCAVDWCTALRIEGKACCGPHHKNGRQLRPQQYKYKPRPNTGRPWDDERPWWEPQQYV